MALRSHWQNLNGGIKMKMLFAAVLLSRVVFAEAGGSPDVTDVATVAEFLTNTVATAVSDVRLYARDEAAACIDRFFAPHAGSLFKTDGPGQTNRLVRMKRHLADDFAFVFSFAARICDLKLDGDAAPQNAADVVVYVYQPRVFEDFSFFADKDCAHIGLRETACAEYVAFSGVDGRRLDLFVPRLGGSRSEGRRLPFKNAKLETAFAVPARDADGFPVEVPASDADVVVIADVESVFFDSIGNLNPSCVRSVGPDSYTTVSPAATYRVELLARKVEKGDFPYQRLAFAAEDAAQRGGAYSDWPFYRGMTLGVRLRPVDGALRVQNVWPVLPYAPFSPARMLTHAFVADDCRFALNPRAANRLPDGAIAGAAVMYGHHTLAKFLVTRNGFEGPYGTFPDYSQKTRVEVWTASEGADPDYWRTAWFSHSPFGGGTGCRVFAAEEGLDELTLLEFRWAPFRPLSVRGAGETLGAFARWLETRTVCEDCGRNHYHVSVDGAAAGRRLTLGREIGYRGAFHALEVACERTGCRFAVEGTNVVVSAELTDAELADDSLEGWLRVLERSGFASVAGARYAAVGFWRRDLRFDAVSPVGKEPYVFSSYAGDYALTGSGWVRTSPDGKRQTLVFDSGWWPNDAQNGFGEPEQARLARDVAKVRGYLRHAADEPDYVSSYRAEGADAYALAFALHLLQSGRIEDARALHAELMRRPGAAKNAFAALFRKVKSSKREYPDFATWLEKSRDATKGAHK